MRDQRAGTLGLRLPVFVLALSAVCFTPAAVIGAPANDGAARHAKRANAPQGAHDATAAIKQLIAKYADAVNAEPVDLGLASQVWLNSPDVSLIYPLGEERGWEQVKRNFYENTMEALFSDRKLTPRDITVRAYDDLTWVEFPGTSSPSQGRTGPSWRPAEERPKFTREPARTAGLWSTCTIRPCRRPGPAACHQHREISPPRKQLLL
jgi:hypothetical protein